MFGKFKQKITDYIDARVKAALPASDSAAPQIIDVQPCPRLTPEQAQELLKLSFQKQYNECFKQITPKGTAQDGAGFKIPKAFGLAGIGQDIIYTFFAKHGFIGWQLCAMLSQHWLIHKACTMPNQDAMRPGWENSFDTEDEAHDTDLLTNLKQKSLSDYHLAQKCVDFGNNRKIFGIGIAFPIVDGVDTSAPFNPDGVKKGSYKGISIIDPYWCLPSWSAETMSQPGSLHFYEPEYYSFPFGAGIKKVHRSHLIISLNGEVPDILKPSYYFGGLPLPQMIYERVYAAEKVANEAPELALTKRLLVVDANLEELYLRPEVVKNKIERLRFLRSNSGVWLKELGDQVQQIDTSLTDFDQLIMTQYQLVSSIAEIPKYKLFGTDLKGFNATGEGETKNYIQTLQSLQENVFKPLIDRHNLLSLRSDFESKERVSVKFNPVDMPTEKELAEVEALKAQTDTAYVNAGILSPEEVRAKVAGDKSNSYNSLSEELPADLNLEEGAFHEGENAPEFEFNIGDEAIGMDPFPNEHAARVKNPEDFEKGSFRRKNLAPGVDVILGRLKSSGQFVPQTYRFKSADFTPAAAKAWLEKHNVVEHGFEAATDALDGQWEESKHPRKDNGQFGRGATGASKGSKASEKKDTEKKAPNQLSQEEADALLSSNWKLEIQKAIDKLPRANNGRPYVVNGDTMVDVPNSMAGESKKEIFKKSKTKEEKIGALFALSHLQELFSMAEAGTPEPDTHQRERVKNIIRYTTPFILEIAGKAHAFNSTFTVREFEGRQVLDLDLLQINKGKDFGLYSVSTQNKGNPV